MFRRMLMDVVRMRQMAMQRANRAALMATTPYVPAQGAPSPAISPAIGAPQTVGTIPSNGLVPVNRPQGIDKPMLEAQRTLENRIPTDQTPNLAGAGQPTSPMQPRAYGLPMQVRDRLGLLGRF